MSIEQLFTLCGSKEEYYRLYHLFDKHFADFLDSSKLNHSGHSHDIIKAISDQVINDYGESWYRQSLDK